jgi:glycosyltransferase involved in cell wall biosynthesis
VIAANSSSLPEVVGEAGWLVDPFDEEEMAAAILALWQNDEVRRDLVQQGYQRAALFPWKRTARVVWKAIELAAEDRVE